MSKEEKKAKPQNSWKFVEERCEQLFGKKRFFYDDLTNRIHIQFDLSNPVQRHEHDTLAAAFTKRRIAFESKIAATMPEGSVIFVAQGHNVSLSFLKEDMHPDFLNRCLLPFAHYSPAQDVDGARSYNSDPIIDKLVELSEVPWVGVVPTPYANEPIYAPAVQTPELTHEQRAEQEHLIAEAFIFGNKRKSAVDSWLERQRATEAEQALPVSMSLHVDLFPSADLLDRWQHNDKSQDKAYLDKVRRTVFKPEISR